MSIARRIILNGIQLSFAILIPVFFAVALTIRILRRPRKSFRDRRVCFGGCGIINYAYWSKALKEIGIDSKTLVWSTPSIYDETTFDYDLQAKWGIFSYLVAPIVFLRSISKADVIICGFDGYVLGLTNLRSIELKLMQLAGCRVVIVPYGGDAFVYRSIRSEDVAHVLQVSYPDAARKQDSIEKDVRRVVRSADFLCPGVMSFDGIGRWDVLAPSSLVIDIGRWVSIEKDQFADRMVVAHSPNHRGFKGTEFLIEAVNNLNHKGLLIDLVLLEKVSNEKVRHVLTNEAHVLVEQIIAPGYGMSGVEGLSSGVVVVANLSEKRIFGPMRRWSFMNECPIVSATPETIEEVLKTLYESRSLRTRLSQLSREYAEKYHSYSTFQEFYTAIDGYLFEGQESLINFYHPILGKSSRVKNKIQTPLIKNEI